MNNLEKILEDFKRDVERDYERKINNARDELKREKEDMIDKIEKLKGQVEDLTEIK